MMILVVGGILFIMQSMITDGSNAYDVPVNTSAWQSQYDYVNQTNETIAPLTEAFNKIGDENNGWFTKLTAGISAIPKAIILIPQLLFDSFASTGSIMTGFATSLNLPQQLIILIGVMLLVWGIIKLVEMYQRWSV